MVTPSAMMLQVHQMVIIDWFERYISRADIYVCVSVLRRRVLRSDGREEELDLQALSATEQ